MPFLPPNQQRQSTEGNKYRNTKCSLFVISVFLLCVGLVIYCDVVSFVLELLVFFSFLTIVARFALSVCFRRAQIKNSLTHMLTTD